MPIYAYKCSACGHAKDVLQKISDDPLTVCPACGASTFSKQVTAAGFQLKGAGWYVTDFRSNGDGANSGVAKPPAEAQASSAAAAPSAPAAAPAVASPSPSPAPAAPASPPAASPAASSSSSS